MPAPRSTGPTRTGSRWSAPTATLRGYVDEASLAGGGTIAEHLQRIETWVAIDGDLQDALATMLLTKVGWVSVLDDDRFVGVLTPEAVYRTLRKSLDDAGDERMSATTPPMQETNVVRRWRWT